MFYYAFCRVIFTITFLSIYYGDNQAILCAAIFHQNTPCNATMCPSSSVGIASAKIDALLATLNEAKCAITNPELWPKDMTAEALNASHLPSYDFIIIGAGSAGSVVAARLSELHNVTVLVLEAGGNPPMESEIFTMSSTLIGTSYAWSDYSENNGQSCLGMKNAKCYWPHGKMIGGTGGLNGNIFLLGSQANYDRWQQLGNHDWSWNEIQHLYRKAITPEIDNKSLGPQLTLNYFQGDELNQILADIIFNATAEMGIPRISNIEDGTRIGYTDQIPATIDHGRRMSTAKTYLGRAAAAEGDRSNLHVLKNAFVTKILIDNAASKRAIGVEFILPGGKKLHVMANKEVILSAGTINSPKILMQSGIGPSKHLRSLKIPVVRDLAVGNNLQDHGLMLLLLKFGRNVELPTSSPVDDQAIFDYLLHQSGPVASSYSLMGFINSDPKSTNPEPDLHLVSHSIQMKGDKKSFKFLNLTDEIIDGLAETLRDMNAIQIYGSLLKPQTRGRLRLRSTNIYDSPKIDHIFASTPEDKATLLRYVRYVQALLKTKTFREFGLELVHVPIAQCDRLPYDTDSYWLCYIKYLFISCWHPVGTCRMGPREDYRTVVDPRLRVHGVTGLRVIDASVMPEISCGNPNGPTIIIAEKGSIMIKEDWNYI